MLPANLPEPALPLATKVNELQRAMRELPQLELPTEHYFADGMYCRVVFRPFGTLIVGKVHRKEHFYIIAKGRVQITSEHGVMDITGPAVLVSKPGTKRAVFAVTDATCMTVHRSDETDLEKLEEELIEPDPDALFNSHNELRALK